MNVDRAYYSIPLEDVSEWDRLVESLYDQLEAGTGFRGQALEDYINNIADEPIKIEAEQLYEFRPTEEDDSTRSKIPYGIVYVFRYRGKLYVVYSQRHTDMVNGKRRIYITIPSELRQKIGFDRAAELYDLPEDVIDVEY